MITFRMEGDVIRLRLGDRVPGVRVNGGAVARLIQLLQQGYIQIQP